MRGHQLNKLCSSFWWNQLPVPSWQRVIQTKSRQTVYSIQAVLKVVFAPARFWKRGARRFVGRFTFGRRWKRLQHFLEDR